jgi:2-iminobutanoate/2-iminopropanoate deaminase
MYSKPLGATVLLLALAAAAMAQTDVKHFAPSSAGLPPGAVSKAGTPAFSGAVMAGDTLYISGTIDIDPATGKPAADAKAGAKLVLDNITRTVESAGLSMDDLVMVQVFATDLGSYPAFNEIYRTYFLGPPPARAFVGAASLLAGAHFEVMGIAVKPKK